LIIWLLIAGPRSILPRDDASPILEGRGTLGLLLLLQVVITDVALPRRSHSPLLVDRGGNCT
jgi:hypothetical protein